MLFIINAMQKEAKEKNKVRYAFLKKCRIGNSWVELTKNTQCKIIASYSLKTSPMIIVPFAVSSSRKDRFSSDFFVRGFIIQPG